MNSEKIMSTDVLDLLFENRNKAYGAYSLRKFYNLRLLKSISLMLSMVLVFSAFTWLPEKKAKVNFTVCETTLVKYFPPIKPKVPAAQPLKAVKPKPPRAAVKFLSNIVITPEVSTDVLTILENQDVGNKTDLSAPVSGHEMVPVSAGSPTGGMIEPPIAEVAAEPSGPILNPEVMPSFPGGTSALRRFLERHLRNPRDLEAGELISVKVRFVVGYDGVLKGFDLVEDGGKEFNEEVMRVIRKMPAWIPGKTNGKNVQVFYTIPVKFIAD